MSYLVLARKYRPKSFDDVIGQGDVVQKLSGALKSGRLGHAFLFCGPRGTGKTSCARILAAELNKIKKDSNEAMEFDSSLDIIEIDGASNRGIDEIRTLRENVRFVPMSGSYKIYIVDEVHMLTGEAFNALLKTLEEPPPHVKFIFATTDPNKLPLTVVSRCQRFDFRRIPLEMVVKQMKDICQEEKITADEDVLYAVAKTSQGSMRDALSILDQLSSAGEGTLTIKDVNAMFGLVETDLLFALAGALAARNCSMALDTLEKIVAGGKDVKQLTQDLVELYRHFMIMKAGGPDLQGLIDYSKPYKEKLFNQSKTMSMAEILKTIDTLIEAEDVARITESPRLALEIAFVKVVSVSASAVVPAPLPSAVKPASTPVPVSAARPVSSGMIKSNKGSVTIDAMSFLAEGAKDAPVPLDDIRRDWNALTHAVSQKRISAGSCLQEGAPVKVVGQKVTIAFGPEHAFQKECLDKMDNIKIISEALSAHFKTTLFVEFMIVDAPLLVEQPVELQNALEIFQGKVVNEWHTEK